MKNYIFDIRFKDGTVKRFETTAKTADEALDELWIHFDEDWGKVDSNISKDESKLLSKIPRVDITYGIK